MMFLLFIQLLFLVLGTIWIAVACWRMGRTAIRTGWVQSIGSRIRNSRERFPVTFWALTACYLAAIPLVVYGFVLSSTPLCNDIFGRLLSEAAVAALPEKGALVIQWRILLALALANIPVYVLIGRMIFFNNLKDALNVARLSIEPEELSAAKGADRFLGNKLSDFILYGYALACLGVVWCEYVVITEFILK